MSATGSRAVAYTVSMYPEQWQAIDALAEPRQRSAWVRDAVLRRGMAVYDWETQPDGPLLDAICRGLAALPRDEAAELVTEHCPVQSAWHPEILRAVESEG